MECRRSVKDASHVHGICGSNFSTPFFPLLSVWPKDWGKENIPWQVWQFILIAEVSDAWNNFVYSQAVLWMGSEWNNRMMTCTHIADGNVVQNESPVFYSVSLFCRNRDVATKGGHCDSWTNCFWRGIRYLFPQLELLVLRGYEDDHDDYGGQKHFRRFISFDFHHADQHPLSVFISRSRRLVVFIVHHKRGWTSFVKFI